MEGNMEWGRVFLLLSLITVSTCQICINCRCNIASGRIRCRGMNDALLYGISQGMPWVKVFDLRLSGGLTLQEESIINHMQTMFPNLETIDVTKSSVPCEASRKLPWNVISDCKPVFNEVPVASPVTINPLEPNMPMKNDVDDTPVTAKNSNITQVKVDAMMKKWIKSSLSEETKRFVDALEGSDNGKVVYYIIMVVIGSVSVVLWMTGCVIKTKKWIELQKRLQNFDETMNCMTPDSSGPLRRTTSTPCLSPRRTAVHAISPHVRRFFARAFLKKDTEALFETALDESQF